jgi:phosphoglycerate dehydrogenase-like enzyme
MLAAARRMHFHLRARRWRQPGLGSPERRLKGATVVIVGTGGIGRALVPMLEPLEVEIVGVNRSGRHLAGASRTVKATDLLKVVPEAHFIVLAAALTDETRGLISKDLLEAMRTDAWVVNVARGGLIDAHALVEALASKSIGGAALDVTDPEPLPDGHPLWSLEDVIITPHIANTWDMALPELRELVRRNVARFAHGEELEGLVDPALGY